MLRIFWNPNGLPLIDAMPKREKSSTRYYVENILTPICQRLILGGKCKLVIHTDNSPCHTASVVFDFVLQRKVRFTSHFPCSPDTAPSDFFLIGDLKRELPALVFRLVRSLLLRHGNWWARSHLKLYWTFFTTEFHGAKVWWQVMGTTLKNHQMVVFILHNSAQRKRYTILWEKHSGNAPHQQSRMASNVTWTTLCSASATAPAAGLQPTGKSQYWWVHSETLNRVR
jgi:hypothetical protein